MMTIYVLFGGMMATSWVQITKAVLLMAGMVIIAFLVLWQYNFNIGTMFTEVKSATVHGADYLKPGLKYKEGLGTISLMLALVLGTSGLPHILMRFFTVKITKAVLLMAGMVIIAFLVLWQYNFNIGTMFTEVKSATVHGADYLKPGLKYKEGLGTISLMLALVLGTSGLPHILMRFFTVKDAREARKSVITATWTIGIFYILTLFLGFGAAVFVGDEKILAANPGGNMAAPLLAEAIGGEILFAFISAVAFATILAVVAGLVLSGASAFAHDLYGQIIKKGKASDREQML